MSEYKQIIDRAARLCSSSEKCQHDIRQKMSGWGLDETEVEKGIKYLVDNKFIDDSRFAAYFVRDKLKFNKWGRVKIRYALQQKRVSDDVIKECMDQLDPDLYNEILDQLIRTKIKSVGKPDTMDKKGKLLRFAAQKGFTSAEIFESIGRVTG